MEGSLSSIVTLQKQLIKIMQIDSEEKVIHANISESDINLLK